VIHHRRGIGEARTILVNGKSDGNTAADQFTMRSLGLLPQLFARDLSRAMVIGFGTGITGGTLAGLPGLRSLDIVDISNGLLHNAFLFDPFDHALTHDARVKLHAMDGFRFMTGTSERFDMIVSQPSNPWMSGVENLFSAEYYKLVRRKLRPGGVFMQWLQTYATSEELVRMVLRTMGGSFSEISVFSLQPGDLALVGFTEPVTDQVLARAADRFEKIPQIREAFRKVGLQRFESVLALERIPIPLTPIIAKGAAIQTLQHPRLSAMAARSQFSEQSASIDLLRRRYPEYYEKVGQSLLSRQLRDQPPGPELADALWETFCERPVSRQDSLCNEAQLMRLAHRHPIGRDDRERAELFQKYYSPVARLPAGFRQPSALRESDARRE
jgi:spermidine synthase